MKTIYDIFEAFFVEDLQPLCSGELFYYLGNPLEIENIRKREGKAGKLNFPAVFLFLDLEENHQGSRITTTPTFAIVNYTDRKYVAEQRSEEVFKPILYPIYHAIVKAIKSSGKFQNNILNYTKTDKYFYGSENSNSEYSSPMDAIVLTFQDLIILKQC